MQRKIRFRYGDRVNGFTPDGKRILGEYRGTRASFGAYVFGIEVGQVEEAKLYVCRTLDMEKAPEKLTYTQKYSTSAPAIKTGDPCKGYSRKLKKWITGFFMNPEGEYVWIKGWPEGTSRFEPKEAYKCLKTSLKRV